MIQEIRLENYKCYRDHTIHFKALNILVGKNNAGKSTIIEALRIIALVVSRYQTVTYNIPPESLNLPRGFHCVSPSLAHLDISLENVFYQRDISLKPKITVLFQGGEKIEICFCEEGIYKKQFYAFVFDEKGKIITSKSQAASSRLPPINAIAQIGPLREKEDILDKDYVRQNLFSHLASWHFRNQLKYFNEDFSAFKKLAEDTWDELHVVKLQSGDPLYDIGPSLEIREDGFSTEIGMVGHGLQMWLQTVWFLARCTKGSTVILDEPDVYLHADMQRKLIRLLNGKFKQVIIATHSVEIISDVEPENVVVIEKGKTHSKALPNIPQLHTTIENLGSNYNFSLVRQIVHGRIIFLEGNSSDINILKILQKTLDATNLISLETLCSRGMGGWNGWSMVLGTSKALLGSGTKIYAVYDSDYHLSHEKEERQKVARENNIIVHIWQRKEIENYLISPSTILRMLENAPGYKGDATVDIIVAQIERIMEEFKEDVTDSYTDAFKRCNHGWDAGRCSKEAREHVRANWGEWDSKLRLICGKSLLSKLSDWTKQNYGVSFSATSVAKELRRDEIDEEMVGVIRSLTRR